MPANNTTFHTQVHATLIRQSAPPVPEKRRLFAWGEKRSPSRKSAPRRLLNGINKNRSRIAASKPEPPPTPRLTAVSFTPREPYNRDYTTVMAARGTPRIASETAPAAEIKPSPVRSDRESREDYRPLNFGERMLRNTAVCVAILLCAVAIKSVNAPVAQTVSSELRNWVTMDLDESLGSLKFVQNLIPDAALVFWHIGSTQTFAEPTEMTLAHGWRESEPYLAYAADKQSPVTASAPGEVMSVSASADGSSSVRIRHQDGLETIYGNLSSATVREGDVVATAQTIGATSALYFEIRSEGRSMNPAPLMAAKP